MRSETSFILRDPGRRRPACCDCHRTRGCLRNCFETWTFKRVSNKREHRLWYGILALIAFRSSNTSPSSTSPNGPKNTTSAPPSIYSTTGLAVTKPDGKSTTYQYYQDAQGRIIENQYTNDKWLINGNSVPSQAIITTDAQDGTPLAATSWSNNGRLYVSGRAQRRSIPNLRLTYR